MRIETFVDHGFDTAIFAHFHDIDAPRAGARKHPVLFLKFGNHALDRALGAEWFAASDAMEGVFFLQDTLWRIPRMKVELRLERDGVFRTGCLAQTACRPGRTGHGAGTTARADIGVDRYRIAIRRYGAGRTKIETAGASRDSGSRMGTEQFVELDVARLVEGTDQVPGVPYHFFDRGAVTRVGTQIARPQLMRGKQRQAAAQIQQDIAGRNRSVAGASKRQPAAR